MARLIRSTTAIAFAVAAVGIASFSAMDAVMKHLALALGAYNAFFWRNGAGAAIAGTIFAAGRRPWPSRRAFRIHLVRGTLGAVMGLLFFWGLARVPLAQGVALSFVAPLVSLYLAALILKERIERRAIFASLLGFAGVLVILAGQARAEMGPDAFRGAVAILLSAILYAYNIVLMRQQALAADPLEIAFFTPLITAFALGAAAPFLADIPDLGHLPAILGGAALAIASMLLLSWAYARAEAQHLAPVEYTAFVWAALFGLIFFAEPVRPPTLAGAAMIVTACILAARRRPKPVLSVDAGLPGGAV